MVRRKQTQPRKTSTPQFEPIQKPISVFLSSAQKEFLKLRQDLKTAIDDMRLQYTKPFQTTLVETQRGERISRDIEEGLDKCDIYILIIGNQESEYTQEEFIEAWEHGVPVLVYLFLKPKAMHPRLSKCLTHKFLYKQVLPKGIRVRGLDKPYRSFEALFFDVSADLASKVTEMIHESARVRKILGR